MLTALARQPTPARVAGIGEQDPRFARAGAAVGAVGEVDARRIVEPGGEDVAGAVPLSLSLSMAARP